MKVTSSYKIEFDTSRSNKILIQNTAKIYRSVVAFCVRVFDLYWDTLSTLDKNNQNNLCNRIIHSTKSNEALYPEFDEKFINFPQGLRKSAVQDALAILSQHHTRLLQGKKSTLKFNHIAFPLFYSSEGCISYGKGLEVKIKVFKDNSWQFISIRLKRTDLIQYIRKRRTSTKSTTNARLHIRQGKYSLIYVLEKQVKYNTKSIKNQRVLGVDLGINNDAVCSILTSDGTIHGRKFINFLYEKDQLRRILLKVKSNQRKYKGGNNVEKLWREFSNKTNNHTILITRAIIQYALENKVDVIVLEHLNLRSSLHRKKRYSKNFREKLQYWRARTLINRIKYQAQLHGIRVSTINPNGTSKYAYDGSGEVKRSKTNYSLCEFNSTIEGQRGKQYNADLNASYNIGARYFLRYLREKYSTQPQVQAKVPGLMQVKISTLLTLIQANKYLSFDVG